MRNHNQKRRDVARSVLPSTRESSQTDRRNIHRAERAATRAVLYNARAAECEIDAHVDFDFDRRIKEFRQERRYADKVGPLEPWLRRSSRTTACCATPR